MKHFNYFFQFLFVIFLILKYWGQYIIKTGGKLLKQLDLYLGQKIIHSNIKKVFPEIKLYDLTKITCSMWNNYGRLLNMCSLKTIEMEISHQKLVLMDLKYLMK